MFSINHFIYIDPCLRNCKLLYYESSLRTINNLNSFIPYHLRCMKRTKKKIGEAKHVTIVRENLPHLATSSGVCPAALFSGAGSCKSLLRL